MSIQGAVKYSEDFFGGKKKLPRLGVNIATPHDSLVESTKIHRNKIQKSAKSVIVPIEIKHSMQMLVVVLKLITSLAST